MAALTLEGLERLREQRAATVEQTSPTVQAPAGTPATRESLEGLRRHRSLPSAVQTGVGAVKKGAEFAQKEVAPRLKESLNGFYGGVANLLGLPVEAVNEALGFAGMQFAEKGDVQGAIRSGFARVGLTTPEQQDTIFTKIGANALEAGLIASGMIATGGTSVVIQRALSGKWGSSIANVLTEITKFAKARPGQTAAIEGVASAGATVGEEGMIPGIPGGPMGALAGGMIGGASLPLAESAIKGGARAAVATGKKVVDVLGFGPSVTARPQPIKPPGSPEFATSVLREQAEADLARLEEMSMNIIRAVPEGGGVEETQGLLRAALESAKGAARAEETSYWRRVASKRPISTDSIVDGISAVRAKFAAQREYIPDDMLQKIMGEIAIVRKNGTVVPRKVSMERLQTLRALLRDERWSEQAGEGGVRPPRGQTIAIYNEVETLILDAMRGSLNNRQLRAFDEAREFSDRLKDSFTTGPIARALSSKSQTGEMMVGQNPNSVIPFGASSDDVMEFAEDATTTLLTKRSGIRALDRIRKLFSSLPRMGRPTEEAIVAAEDGIRALFREVADLDPAKGIAWITRQQKLIRPLATASAELDQTLRRLTLAEELKTAYGKSAIARWTGMQKDSGVPPHWTLSVRHLFTSPKAVDDATQLVRKLQPHRLDSPAMRANKEEALDGFRAGVIEELARRTEEGGEIGFLNALRDPRMRQVFEIVFPKDTLTRILKITEAAEAVHAGNDAFAHRVLTRSGYLGSKIIGAMLGRQLNSITHSPTIQTPGIVSQAFANTFERAVADKPLHTLIYYALRNPDWEAVLLRRMPTSISEMNKMATSVRRVLSAVEGVREGYGEEAQSRVTKYRGR